MTWLVDRTALRYLARGPVCQPLPFAPSKVVYHGAPAVTFPVSPVLAWGAAYDLDLVLVSDHPAWDMHEIARLPTPSEPMWVVKEARRGSREQVVTAALADPDAWLPELPVLRHPAAVDIDDRSRDGRIDLTARWTTADGEHAEAALEGPVPSGPARWRNGPTLGHSRAHLLAVLDVGARSPLARATLTIGGVRRRISRIAGLVPFRFALVQAQGGLATGSWEIEAVPGGLSTTHAMRSGARVSLAWTVADGVATQVGPLRTLTHRFVAGELTESCVSQNGQLVTRVRFSPALPDVSRPFSGAAASRWTIEINGQPPHAAGRAVVTATPGGAVVDVIPQSPSWVADRPLRSTVLLGSDGRARVITARAGGDRGGRAAR